MAVIAVSDFDPAAVRALITRHFGAIPTSKATKLRPFYSVPRSARHALRGGDGQGSTLGEPSIYSKMAC